MNVSVLCKLLAFPSQLPRKKKNIISMFHIKQDGEMSRVPNTFAAVLRHCPIHGNRSSHGAAATKVKRKSIHSCSFSTVVGFFFCLFAFLIEKWSEGQGGLARHCLIKDLSVGYRVRGFFFFRARQKRIDPEGGLSKIQSLAGWAPNRKTRVAALLEGRI